MASLVLELQENALNKEISPTELLRKALVVATKLEIKEFKNWINNELHGYKSPTPIPEYRKIFCKLKAFNPYRGLIPAQISDPELEEQVCTRKIAQPISEIEALINAESLALSLAGQELLALQQIFGTDFDMQLIPTKTAINRICEHIRTVVLEWALKLEEQGITGQGLSFSVEEKQKAHNNQYITNIENFHGVLGDSHNSHITQHFDKIAYNSFDSLTTFLQNQGISNNDVAELKKAIETDKSQANELPSTAKKLGTNVIGWIGNMTVKLAQGALTTGANITTSLLVSAISRYYGIN